MKKYQIRRHGNTFKVLENETKQYVAESSDRNKAKKYMKHLEDGCGFGGNTPTFLMAGRRYGVNLDKKTPTATY